MTTIFHQIIDGKIECNKIYEDDLAIGIYDTHPAAPIHILIIPKKSITCLEHVEDEDTLILGHLLQVAKKIAKNLNIETGYRIVINNGIDAGQTVYQLHVHLIAGRGFAWPPG